MLAKSSCINVLLKSLLAHLYLWPQIFACNCAYSCAMQQKEGDWVESVAPFEVVDHGSKLAVRAQWLSALKVRLKPTELKPCNFRNSRLNSRTFESHSLLNFIATTELSNHAAEASSYCQQALATGAVARLNSISHTVISSHTVCSIS